MCHIEDTEIGVLFLVAMYRLIVRRPNLEVVTKRSAGKDTRIVLVLCCAWKCIPIAIYSGVDISEVPGCHFLQ